ncbi:hypothetical protein Tco_1034139 [Tanacetum coccineum]
MLQPSFLKRFEVFGRVFVLIWGLFVFVKATWSGFDWSVSRTKVVEILGFSLAEENEEKVWRRKFATYHGYALAFKPLYLGFGFVVWCGGWGVWGGMELG